MTTDQVQPLLSSIVRHGLTLLAGYLVARGAFNPTTAGGFVEGLSGVLVGLIGFGWSLARAGRLGTQALAITDLLDRLTLSVPISVLAGQNNALVLAKTSDGNPVAMVPATAQNPSPDAVVSPPQPGPLSSPLSPWPLGSSHNPAPQPEPQPGFQPSGISWSVGNAPNPVYPIKAGT